MAEEKTVALDCDQYEDFKEEFIKAFKAEIAKLQGGGDNTALMQRIDEIARVQNLSAEQITNFINRIGQIDIKPVVEVQRALSDEKIKKAVQLFVSREVEKYKEMLDGHWSRINSTLDHLLHRIPYNYDINKRLVRACV